MKRGLLEKLRRLGILMLCTACVAATVPVDVHATTTKTPTQQENDDDSNDNDTGNQSTGSTPEEGKEQKGGSENVSGEDDKEPDSPSGTPEDGVSSTSEFLIVGDCVPTPTASYGQKVHLILPIYNMGVETVTNLVITPTVSTKAEEWPFRLDTVGLVQCVDYIPQAPIRMWHMPIAGKWNGTL